MKNQMFLALMISGSLLAGVGCGSSKSGAPAAEAPSVADPVDPNTCTSNCPTIPSGYRVYQGEINLRTVDTNKTISDSVWKNLIADQNICYTSKPKGLLWGSWPNCSDFNGRYFKLIVQNGFAVAVIYAQSNSTQWQQRAVTQNKLFAIKNNTGYELRGTSSAYTASYKKVFQALIENQKMTDDQQQTLKIRLRYNDQELGSVSAMRIQ